MEQNTTILNEAKRHYRTRRSRVQYCCTLLHWYRIKSILFSILSLSGPLSGEPDLVNQMMVLIKTVSKTNSPLFCLSVIYIQKSLQRWKKDFLQIQKIFRVFNSVYFHAKTILFGDYFLAYFGLWSVIHSKTHALHFQLNYECDVIFTVPQICA
jgi:hypothetical protein